MSHTRTLALILILLVAGIATAQPAPTLRVLFIGNSLTASNDLPGLVAAVSRADGGPRIVAKGISPGGHSLGDHLERSETLLALGEGDWDFVVLQQGPSALPESRVLLRQDVARWAELIRANGAEPAVYMVWPESYRDEVFPDVVESYRLAARDVGALLLPAGRAWQIAWTIDPATPLYSFDGFHPSREGSLLAALVIYEGLTGRTLEGARWKPRPRDKRTYRLPKAAPSVLMEAAARARAEMGGR